MVGGCMNFTDVQVLALVRQCPGLNLYRLMKQAQKDMARWPWTVGKIQASVSRLEKAGRVEKKSVVVGGRACVQVYLKP